MILLASSASVAILRIIPSDNGDHFSIDLFILLRSGNASSSGKNETMAILLPETYELLVQVCLLDRFDLSACLLQPGELLALDQVFWSPGRVPSFYRRIYLCSSPCSADSWLSGWH
jgi:hypothetical protein